MLHTLHTGAVDTFWVGRMGNALALAGQGAANQVFNAFFFVVGFVPKVTVPLVAKAFAAGDAKGAADRTCDSLFVACVVGALGTALLVGAPQLVLRTVIPPDALAAPLATRYLRLRALSIVPAAFSAVAFAAFRGTLDATTPLRVSVASNLVCLAYLKPRTTPFAQRRAMLGSLTYGLPCRGLAQSGPRPTAHLLRRLGYRRRSARNGGERVCCCEGLSLPVTAPAACHVGEACATTRARNHHAATPWLLCQSTAHYALELDHACTCAYCPGDGPDWRCCSGIRYHTAVVPRG